MNCTLFLLARVFIGAWLFSEVKNNYLGINAIFYFSSVVFKSAGVPSDIGNISVGVVNLLGNTQFHYKVCLVICHGGRGGSWSSPVRDFPR
ncbi:hypothetical protein Leryth_025971 [Lithospermum erythrorhizon]|nr:hypothetical protein Leryth_025971 [Lithospermum erythrorhizon]